MLFRSLRLAAVFVLGSSALAACSFLQADEGPEQATYYVALGKGPRVTASRVALEYTTPDGVQRDTIRGAGLTWSRVFDRDALETFRLTATNLTAADTGRDRGFIAASLISDGDLVAFDSARVTATVDAAAPVLERTVTKR